MARLRAENAMLPEAPITPTDDEAEAEKPKEEEATGAPLVLESFLMTPQRPPAPSPWAESGWAPEPGYWSRSA